MIKKKIKSANTRKIDELNTAIAINDFNAMHEILITDIDVNVPDSHGVFPAMYAVEYGNANALIALIRHGANVNVIYKQTFWAIHNYSTQFNHFLLFRIPTKNISLVVTAPTDIFNLI